MDKLESTLIQECMEKNEARVFKNIFPDILSVEEFNKLLNLRSFQTTQRLIPTKEVRKLTKWKNLSDQDIGIFQKELGNMGYKFHQHHL